MQSGIQLRPLWNSVKKLLDEKQTADYLYFGLLEDWWDIHVTPRIRHYLYHERCENCRCWEYMGRHIINKKSIAFGKCAWNAKYENPWTPANSYCFSYNVMPTNSDMYTTFEDGWEDEFTTPAGKKITRISKNGRWMYLHDGHPYWWD